MNELMNKLSHRSNFFFIPNSCSKGHCDYLCLKDFYVFDSSNEEVVYPEDDDPYFKSVFGEDFDLRTCFDLMLMKLKHVGSDDPRLKKTDHAIRSCLEFDCYLDHFSERQAQRDDLGEVCLFPETVDNIFMDVLKGIENVTDLPYYLHYWIRPEGLIEAFKMDSVLTNINVDDLNLSEILYLIYSSNVTEKLRETFRVDEFNAFTDVHSKFIEYAPCEHSYYERALHFASIGNEHALEDFQKAVSENDHHIWAWVSIFKYHRNLDDNDSAFDILENLLNSHESGYRIIHNDDFLSTFYCLRGQVHERRNDHEKAFDDYNLAVQQCPENCFAYTHRAEFFEDVLQDKESSIEDHKMVVELDPESLLSTMALSRLLLETDLFEESILYTDALIKLLKEGTDEIDDDEIEELIYYALLHRGLCFMFLSQYSKAVEDFTFCLENPCVVGVDQETIISTLENRIYCYDMMGEEELSKKDRDEILIYRLKELQSDD